MGIGISKNPEYGYQGQDPAHLWCRRRINPTLALARLVTKWRVAARHLPPRWKHREAMEPREPLRTGEKLMSSPAPPKAQSLAFASSSGVM